MEKQTLIVNGESFCEDRLRNRLVTSGIYVGLHDGVIRYLMHHVRPGSFLASVLANDIVTAIRCGDEHSIGSLVPLVRFLMEHAPIDAWLSHDAVDAWTDARRMGVA